MSQGIKRKRAKEPLATAKKHSSLSDETSASTRAKAVRGDNLRWKKVKVSRHLDDAEGFFGLEELSDVDIVQDQSGKGLLFKPKADSAIKEDNEDDEEDLVDEVDEAWSGFDDEEADEAMLNKDAIEVTEETNQAREASNESTAPAKQIPADEGGLDENARFDLLTDEANEPEIDMSAWQELGLSSNMLHALSALKFAAPTKIQAAAIPVVYSGKDVIGKAVTGSGKTLAFGIPIIDSWLDMAASEQKQLSALILAPTRELAHQIAKHFSDVCKGLDVAPRVVTITGGLSVQKQQRQLETANIVVGTPGRLWEVISGSSSILERFKSIRYLVADEADRLLSEGHFQEVEDILDAIDREVVEEDEDDAASGSNGDVKKVSRQTLVFSATFHKELQQKLASKQKKRQNGANDFLSDKQSLEYLMHKLPFQAGQKPAFVDANPDSQLAENLTETILECKAMEKDLYLYTFLLQDQNSRKKTNLITNDAPESPKIARILVFTNSVSAVKRLVPLLQSLGLPSTSISPLHSNMPQKSRLRSLERFAGTNGNSQTFSTTILVATDVAARGLDIKGVTTIVHYHVPRSADTYVHRSGRTARVDRSGKSILLCSPEETAAVTKLIAKLHARDKSVKELKNIVDRMYLPGSLVKQVQLRIELAQKLVDSNQNTEKVRSEDSWLRKAAEDLGVDYDSDEFEKADAQTRRGRGGGRSKKQKADAESENRKGKLSEWKARLRDELGKRIDFGDGVGRNGRYLAGGAYDVDKLLAERAIR